MAKVQYKYTSMNTGHRRSTHLPEEVHRQLKLIAAQEGTSILQLLLRAIREVYGIEAREE
jgi:predicted DNA-binding ribbon-helix-helix protein